MKRDNCVMGNSIFTICIPTYNGGNDLKKCLDSIIAQEQFNRIEIIISDNCSTDNTQDICKHYSNFPNIKYNRNNENVGPDKNFLKALSLVDTKYCMLLGDDDFVGDGFLKCILDYLDVNDADYIQLSSKYDGVIEFNKKDFNDFFKKVNIYFTFMSNLIFNRDILNQVLNKEDYIGSYLLQMGLVMECINRANKVAIIGNIKIDTTSNENVGYNLYNVFVKQYKKILWKSNISYFAKRSTFKACLKYIASFIKTFRLNGYKQKMGIANFFRLVTYFKAWIFVYPMYFFPKWIIRKI